MKSHMKSHMKSTCLAVLLLMPFSGQAGEIRLVIVGDGVSGKTIYVAVHDSPDGFPGNGRHADDYHMAAASDRIEVVLPRIAPGDYAIAAYADMNGNGKLDKNFLGIPKEPVGISNDVKVHFSPPSFASAVFHVGEGTVTQTIHLE